MRSDRGLSIATVLLATVGLAWPATLSATAMTWGTAEDWLERCELGERYARADAVGEDPGMPAAEVAEAGLCLGFLSGFELGFLMARLDPASERADDDPSPASDEAPRFCVDEAYDEVVARLVAHLRSEEVGPEAEFANVLHDFYLAHYSCDRPAAAAEE